MTLIVKSSNSISSNYWKTAFGYKSIVNAFHKLGFDLSVSYFIGFLIQIIVKLKRILFKYIFPNSKNVIDYHINKYLNSNNKLKILKLRVALLTIFYYPKDSDLISFIELSKSFNGRFCFINSPISKNSLDLLKGNNIEIYGDGSNVGISRAYNIIY